MADDASRSKIQFDNRWFLRSPARPNASLRIFCLPFAGAGASAFRSWASALPAEVEVVGVRLPGRESRRNEPTFTRMDPLIDALLQSLELNSHLDLPYALFGHSMGALIAYELTQRLITSRMKPPIHLFLSGRRAPDRATTQDPIHDLPRHEFIAKLREYDGTDEAIFEQSELLELIIPVLRADFALCETYQPAQKALLTCPITALGGVADREVTVEDLAAWRLVTRGEFDMRLFRGNHFFINSARQEVLCCIRDALRRYLS